MATDVNLTFDNAMMYNAKGTDVHALAKELKKFFNDKVKKAIKEDDEFLSAQRLKYDNCFFCGLSMDDKIVKLQCIYYCSGFKCGGARIQKNPYYEYKSSKSKMMQYFWLVVVTLCIYYVSFYVTLCQYMYLLCIICLYICYTGVSSVTTH